MTDTRDWKPRGYRRDGKIRYCSPACGNDCTRDAHELALHRAEKAAEKLGDGWRVKVWENLGWFASVVSPCGRIEIHCKGPRRFWANYRTSVKQFTVDATTPASAFSKVVGMAQNAWQTLRREIPEQPKGVQRASRDRRIDFRKRQFHVGKAEHGEPKGRDIWHTSSDGTWWSGSWGHRTAEQLYAESQSIMEGLEELYPGIGR